MKTNLNLQDIFLNQVRKEKIPVTMYLMNGVKIVGTVRGFDSFLVIVENCGMQNAVYKHAISTIIPARAVNILTGGGIGEQETA
ncbi:MAG: RNA chaperone Hfq [Bacillota bacterium]|nr:RNA chaperone Hfq [Bacillota bacterium]